MSSGAGASIMHGLWVFYALGPQLVLCMGLAYLAARRTHGSLLTWLVGGFLASVVPILGVVVMAVLYWRTARSAGDA